MAAEYVLTVVGCDDSTSVIVTLDPSTARILRAIAEQVTSASSYGCEPTMKFAPIDKAETYYVEQAREAGA